MKRKHSLKLVIVSLAFLCWLIPILLMVAVMGYYVLSKQDDEQLERLAEQMAASSRICQERLDGAIANSRRISYDKTVQQKYEQYQRGELSYAALYSEVQYYLSVEYSRKKEAAFALIMMNGKEKDESFNVVNSSAGGSYQGILEFWEQDAELVKECAAKLDTAIGFVQNQGRLYLVRNMMNSRFKSWGVIVLCLNKDYCFETLLSGQENIGLSVDLSGENVLSQGISGKLPELTWDPTGRYQVEKGKIYLTFRIKSSDYTLKTLMIHSREELPVPLYGYEYVVIGMLACLLPLCLLMFVVFRRQVNQPIRTLMESAGEIEKGNLGYQISEEAAYMEGCTAIKIFFKVIMPLTKPSFATVGIFSFIWSYNDLFTQQFFLRNKEQYAITRLLLEISSREGTNYGLMAAVVSLIVVPMLIVYACLQKYIIKGMTAGALKG